MTLWSLRGLPACFCNWIYLVTNFKLFSLFCAFCVFSFNSFCCSCARNKLVCFANSSSFNSSVRLISHFFVRPGRILIFSVHSSSSNSSLRLIRHLFIFQRNILFVLFVICRFESMFKQYSQLCWLLRDGWVRAFSVVSLTRVRFKQRVYRIYSLQENFVAAVMFRTLQTLC